MQHRNRASLIASSFAALLLIAAGCSGGDDSSADGQDGDGTGVESSADDSSTTDGSITDDESSDQGGESESAEEGSEVEPEESNDPTAVEPGTVVRLVTHDSFSVSDGLFDNFTLDTGIEVEVIKGGDAGELVARAVLTAGDPEADVLFGIDNTFLQRGLDAELFLGYESPLLSVVPDELELDPENRVTPIDFGDVCVNYWTENVVNPPTSLDDLTDPAFAASFVTEDPESSSPGFAFLLATIAEYGEDGWEDYWQQLRDGGVTVTPGWNEAYYGEFVAGGGDKALVTSYASSPVAEVLFAAEPIDTAPTGVMADGCFRQIEFAGILSGTDVEAASRMLIDFMLSDIFQSDIPLNMFVVPASTEVPLPELFVAHAAKVDNPLTLSPADIEANRSDWTERWAEIVLR
ncbi:MAG: thiamine ABC transporter substrate-binding protein [Acidimicrobiales bacterium]